MVAAAATPKAKLAALLSELEKKHGVHKTIGGGATIEQCVFLILREGWDFKKASRAVRILASTFIDWNEVRVSSNAELLDALAELKGADLGNRLTRVKSFLNAVMNELTDLDNDMFKGMEFEPLRRLLLAISELGKANAYTILQLYRNERAKKNGEAEAPLIVSPEAMRIGIRTGLIKKTQSANTARVEFSKLLDPEDFPRFQNLMARHADQLCLAKNPVCGECAVNSDCKSPQSR